MVLFGNLVESIRKGLSGKFIQCVACITASIASFNNGLYNAWLSPVLPKLTAPDSKIPINANEETWLTSLSLMSLVTTSLFAIKLVRVIGNKHIILCSCIPLLMSITLIIFATSVEQLYLARILSGICDAMCFVSVPAYFGEIADGSIRGILSTSIMIMFNSGIVVTYYFAHILPLKTYPMYCLPVPIITFILFLFLPQSPSYLISKGRIEDAKKLMTKIRDSDISKEFEEIRSNLENNSSVLQNYINLVRIKVNLKATLIVLLTLFIWIYSGVIIMATYLHTIILEAQINLPEIIPIVIYSLVQCFSGFGCALIVDRLGRKPLLYISCAGTSVCLFTLGTYFFLKNMNYDVSSITLLPVISLLAYVFFCSMGLGNIPVIYTSELFDYNMKNYGGTVFALGFGTFGVSSNVLFQAMLPYGMHVIFWILTVSTILGILFTYLWFPETKNKSINEIQQLLCQKKSKNYVTKF